MQTPKELIQHQIEALQNIPITGEIENAVELIFDHIHKREGKVISSGVGKAGHIALQLSSTLCSTGTPACFLDPLAAQHGDLGVVQRGDILFLVSNSGKTYEILKLVEITQKLFPQIPIIVLTRNRDSELVKKANIAIFTGETIEICPLRLTPTTSTTAMKVIIDILIVLLMDKIALGIQMYSLRHPGGSLGKISAKSPT